jgi:hypothetical protein
MRHVRRETTNTLDDASEILNCKTAAIIEYAATDVNRPGYNDNCGDAAWFALILTDELYRITHDKQLL